MNTDGLILFDKPSGMTSHDVVAKIRRALSPGKSFRKQAKCGHTGTLDPLATGLMLILCGRATRLSKYLTGLDKKYSADVVFGVETDTLDSDGQIIGKYEVNCSEQDLLQAVNLQIGKINQIPPKYSAIKINGKRSCDRVRDGEDIATPEPRQVSIYSLECEINGWGVESDSADVCALDNKSYQATITTECSSGTYVRSLVRDLAESVGTKGHLTKLRRETIADYKIVDALPATEISNQEALVSAMLPMSSAVSWAPSIILSDEEVKLTRIGVQPDNELIDRIVQPESEAVSKFPAISAVDSNGNLVAIMKLVDGNLSLDTVIPPVASEK
jgi:tRNA pseudouridine55 synthase